jgi:hypothetical protein
MKRLILLGCLWAVPLPLEGAWAHVQTATAVTGDDAALTFAAAPGASNHIIVVVTIPVENQTVSIADWAPGITTTIGPIDDPGANALRQYIFCAAGDGSDTVLTPTTSGTAATRVMAAEFSGGSCTQDGSTQHNAFTGAGGVDNEYVLTTDVTTSSSGSLVIGAIQSTSTASYTAGTNYTLMGSSGPSGAEYRITVGTGSFDTTWRTAAAETVYMVGAAFTEAGGGGGGGTASTRLLLGVGGW